MSVRFHIFPERGLVYVHYQGFVRFEDTASAVESYYRHPDYAPGQKQLVDLSEVTGYERDFAKLMAVQARKADVFQPNSGQTLLMYFAPTRVSYDLAMTARKSWEGLEGVIILIQEDEATALSLMGVAEPSLEALRQSA